jgi:hypothetical protein
VELQPVGLVAKPEGLLEVPVDGKLALNRLSDQPSLVNQVPGSIGAGGPSRRTIKPDSSETPGNGSPANGRRSIASSPARRNAGSIPPRPS